MATVPEVLRHPSPWPWDWHPARCWAGHLSLSPDMQKDREQVGLRAACSPGGQSWGRGVSEHCLLSDCSWNSSELKSCQTV